MTDPPTTRSHLPELITQSLISWDIARRRIWTGVWSFYPFSRESRIYF